MLNTVDARVGSPEIPWNPVVSHDRTDGLILLTRIRVDGAVVLTSGFTTSIFTADEVSHIGKGNRDVGIQTLVESELERDPDQIASLLIRPFDFDLLEARRVGKILTQPPANVARFNMPIEDVSSKDFTQVHAPKGK